MLELFPCNGADRDAIDNARITEIAKAMATGGTALAVEAVIQRESVFEKQHAVISQYREKNRRVENARKGTAGLTRPRELKRVTFRTVDYGYRPDTFRSSNAVP